MAHVVSFFRRPRGDDGELKDAVASLKEGTERIREEYRQTARVRDVVSEAIDQVVGRKGPTDEAVRK